MSTIGERLAWLETARAGSPANKAILFALVTHCDADWTCWPSAETIAETSEASIGHVRRCLSEWEADGRISRQRRRSSDGRWRSSVIVIHPEKWTLHRAPRALDHRAPRAQPSRTMRVASAHQRASEPSLEPPLEPRADAHHARWAPGSGVIGERSNCPTCDGTGFTLDDAGAATPCQRHITLTHTDNDASEEAVAEHPPIDEARKALRRLSAVQDAP